MNRADIMQAILLVVLTVITLQGHAANWSFRGPHDPVPHNADEYVWQGEVIDLPEYPDKERMLEIDFQRPDARYRFFLDPRTLRVADNDVVHYVLLLRSQSGAENLMYEGMRCQTGSYRTMAYGTRSGKFRALRKPRWKTITKTSNNWFRAELQRRYFCNPHRLEAVTAHGILERIKHPPRDQLE